MSRFQSLEFDGAPDERFQSEERVLKDEAHYLALARDAYAAAEFEQGLRFYARALEENPRSATAWAGQVRMLIELGEPREAKAWADKALEALPNEPELLAAKAVALARLDLRDEALALSDGAIEERGCSPYLWLARADVLHTLGEKRADYCLEKALGMAPGDWFTAWLAGRVQLFHQRFAQALKLLQSALALDAARWVVWVDLGRCQVALGFAEHGARSYEQALALNPDCAAARQALVDLRHPTLSQRFVRVWRRMTGG